MLTIKVKQQVEAGVPGWMLDAQTSDALSIQKHWLDEETFALLAEGDLSELGARAGQGESLEEAIDEIAGLSAAVGHAVSVARHYSFDPPEELREECLKESAALLSVRLTKHLTGRGVRQIERALREPAPGQG